MIGNIAIVGTGPTAIYLLQHLIAEAGPCFITLYERSGLAGVGMPYNPETTHAAMLANIASIEVPPVAETLLSWLQRQPQVILDLYGVSAETLSDRTFVPRVLLGGYFRDALETLVARGREAGVQIALREGSEVVDLRPDPDGIWLEIAAGDVPQQPILHDRVILAIGHSWPQAARVGTPAPRRLVPSPWSGLLEGGVPAAPIGILGTSLSAIDALVAVVLQHGSFTDDPGGGLVYTLLPESRGLHVTLMSRNGLLPEADFYCPLPYDPPKVMTAHAVAAAVGEGNAGLLDRLFALFLAEFRAADPAAPVLGAADEPTPDTFADHYFAARKAADPFDWAAQDLREAEANQAACRTVAWKYAILRVHEIFDAIYGDFDAGDRARFDAGLKRVFIDNYAAVPPHSIHRLLALRRAGLIDVLALGEDYEIAEARGGIAVNGNNERLRLAAVIDARGQGAQGAADLPFAGLRAALDTSDERGGPVPLSGDLEILCPAATPGRIWLPAAPFLLHRRPFLQGIPGCAAMGREVGAAVVASLAAGPRGVPAGPYDKAAAVPVGSDRIASGTGHG